MHSCKLITGNKARLVASFTMVSAGFVCQELQRKDSRSLFGVFKVILRVFMERSMLPDPALFSHQLSNHPLLRPTP